MIAPILSFCDQGEEEDLPLKSLNEMKLIMMMNVVAISEIVMPMIFEISIENIGIIYFYPGRCVITFIRFSSKSTAYFIDNFETRHHRLELTNIFYLSVAFQILS
jgi:hypothetical protein